MAEIILNWTWTPVRDGAESYVKEKAPTHEGEAHELFGPMPAETIDAFIAERREIAKAAGATILRRDDDDESWRDDVLG